MELAGVGVDGVGADVVDGLCLIQLGKVVALSMREWRLL